MSNITTNNNIVLSGAITARVVLGYTKWGKLEGNISDQTDLKEALDSKVSTSSLTQEVTRATTAEQNLNTAINAEKTRAETKESALETSLASEATTRSNADTTLTNALNSEVTRAKAKENELGTTISNETSRATISETQISARIKTIEDDYLKGADKDSILQAIQDLKDFMTPPQGYSYLLVKGE